MYRTLANFKERYKHLEKKGLRILGLKLVDPTKKSHVLEISRPLVFDSRVIPDRYEGLRIKRRIHGALPEEFQIDREAVDWHKKEYVWAPERFEKYVARCSAEIRTQLGNEDLTDDELLDALCFGNFKAHKEKVEAMIAAGDIPPYQES